MDSSVALVAASVILIAAGALGFLGLRRPHLGR
jgi:ABC-type Fe3+-siderophore transport system permease subunit